jgi:hypothetical protein
MVAAHQIAPILEGFPEITDTHPKCVTCELARRNPNVVRVLHELYRQGLSQRPLFAKMEPVYAEAEEEMPRRQSVMRHLQNHVTPSRIVYEFGGVANAPAEAPKGNDHETDYFEMRRLYAELKPILKQVREKLTLQSKDDKISGYDLVMLLKLFGEARQILKALSEMRNSEKLTSIILVRHTEALVHLLTEPLGTTLRDIRDRLNRGENPERVTRRLDDLLDGELFPLFESAAERAIAQSKEQYKLH